MNKLIKPAKVALAKKYGYKNVSVRNGRGTAWGWVEVSINVRKPESACPKDHNFWEDCRNCYRDREAQHVVSNEAKQIIFKAWKDAELSAYTYSPDDGYSSDRACLLVDVNYI